MHRRLIALAWGSRPALTLSVVAGVLGGWLVIGQAYLLSRVVSRVFLGQQALAQVQDLLALLLAIIVCRGLLLWISDLAANRISRRVKAELRSRLLRHIFDLGPAFVGGEKTGELTAAVIDGIEALDAYFGQYLPQLIVGALVPTSILLVVFPRDWLSGLILLLTAPLIPFFMYMIGRDAGTAAARQYGSLARLSSHFLDSLQGLSTLKAFGQSKPQAGGIARVSDEFRRLTLKVMQGSFLSAFALELLATICTAIIAVEVGLRLLYAQMQFDQALFLLILAPEFYLPLRLLGQRFHAGLAGVTAARRIFAILDTPLPGASPLHAPPQAAFPDLRSGSWSVDLQHVSFTYPGRARPAVHNIDLHIGAGQHIALVGQTGAGKSTLARLLLGLMDPAAGRISVRSESRLEVKDGTRRRLMAWVPQHPHLFNDTIAANLRLAMPGASPEQIARAARLAHLDTVIEALPDGYETGVAEAGSRLSSGERQRLALARAFLRDAPILILDEPTSALDPENETLLEESTHQLMAGRTVITIAHRLNTVFKADLIVVMRDGELIEAGTHQELLTRGGEYSRLVDASTGSWIVPAPGAEPVPAPSFPIDPTGASLPLTLPDIGERRPKAAARHNFQELPAPSSFVRILGFLHGSWGWIGLSVLLASLTIGSSVALMGTSAWLISAAALHPSIAALDLAIVGVRFFGIARAVFRYLERLVTHGVTLQLLRNIRVWFYERIEPLAPARLMGFASGDLLARAVEDVNTLENFFVRVLNPPLTAILVLVGASAFLGAIDLRLAMPLLGFSLLIGVMQPAIAGVVSRVPAIDLVRTRSALRAHLVNSLQGLPDIVAFDFEAAQLAVVRSAEEAYATAQDRMARHSSLQSALSVALSQMAAWSLLVVAIPPANHGRIAGTMVASLVLITVSAFEAINPLPAAAQWWNAVRSAASRLFDLVDTPPAVSEPGTGFGEVTLPSSSCPAFSIRNLTFTYPGQSSPALSGISFDLPKGCNLAVVGPSGAGKSTLANLLMRFWEYDSGELYLDGRPLRNLPPDSIRANIGLVSQETYLFDTTIYENLRMAGRRVSRPQVERACQTAGIHDFVARLPLGYDTMVGEHGLRLSAGERQRLAIARAVIKDAPILILDEPTANLDTVTERAVLESLFQLMRGKTCLLITHRLVGLEHMQEILVLDHGGLVERGSHALLLTQGGTYRRLWDLQNRIRSAP